MQKVLVGGYIPCTAGSAQGAQCPTPSAAQEQGPRSSIFPPAPGRDLSSYAQESETAEFSGQVGKGSWERKRENEEEREKKTLAGFQGPKPEWKYFPSLNCFETR